MAKSDQTNAPADQPQAEAAEAAQADATPKPEFDWDAMPEPVAMMPKAGVGNIKVDVLTSVPEAIRKRAEASLALSTKAKAKAAQSKAKRPRIDYRWDFQAVTDDKMAAAFDKHLAKYAKYRPSEGDIPHADEVSAKGQCTARTGNPGHFRKGADGEYVACKADAEGATYGLRYSVRPLEVRNDAHRLPGTA